MRMIFWLLWLPCLATAAPTADPPAAGEPSSCPDCHPKQYQAFKRSRMAVAARTPDFIREWSDQGRGDQCLTCHAPSGGEGVNCQDCHGDGGHPYPRLETPQVCARCHDAPGELTVRSYRQSPAARRGEGCLDCHLAEGGSSHDFEGPMRSGFLDGIAHMRISMRRDDGADTLLVRISHRAGHALPGGTTGRSVWLLVEARTPLGQSVVKSTYRFGWFHDTNKRWQDRTLPPGPGHVIEIPLQNATEIATIEATLIYRFKPGPLEPPDPQQVALDRVKFTLQDEMEKSR